jgi:hypothetical protein
MPVEVQNAEGILMDVMLKLVKKATDGCETLESDKQHVREAVAEFKKRVQSCDQLDGKFAGMVWRRRDGRIEEQFVCFVPRDKCLPYTLLEYASR